MTTPHEQAQQAASAALTTTNEEIAALSDWQIQSQEDLDLAGTALQDVKARHKAIEAKRTSITGPMNKAKKAVDDLFRAPKKALAEAEGILKEKIAAYMDEQERANDAHLEAAAGAGTIDEARAQLIGIANVEAPAGVSVRHVFKPRIVAEDLLDRRFLVPDMRAIEAHAKAHVLPDGSPAPIPGVLFDKVPIVASRVVKR